MSNKDYFDHWLKLKYEFELLLQEDEEIQRRALERLGLKPQATAVEAVARVYAKYCDFYNKLCDCYDQMTQVQRRPHIKKIIDGITCRLIELKSALQEIEVFEYTYTDNALQQMLIVPQDIEILCPFHYPFETREQEMQFIVDKVFSEMEIEASMSSSQNITNDQETTDKNQENKIITDQVLKPANTNQKINADKISDKEPIDKYNLHLLNIQRMERSRYITREKTKKFNKDKDLYLELAGLKSPLAREELRIKAAKYIQTIYRRYMEIKREKLKEKELQKKLGMIIPSWSPPSAKLQLEKVKEARRNFRRKYHEEWLRKSITENTRILRLKGGGVMEDISSEIRQWFQEWYDAVGTFDEFPWPLEGGSILIVKGETFTIPEYIEWRTKEIKRLAVNEDQDKQSKKEGKKAAAAEKARRQLEENLKERKLLLEYQKSRLDPETDPGVLLPVGKHVDSLQENWKKYQSEWKELEKPYNKKNVMKGYIMELMTEIACQEMQYQLRPIVDDMMRLELAMLKKSLKLDYDHAEKSLPLTKKRKKPRKLKKPKKQKVTPEEMFQTLVKGGVIHKYPHKTLDDFWGDRNYAAADSRAILWKPTFPPPCLGDVKEQVRVRCLLTQGSDCQDAVRNHMLVGPKNSGKKTIAYAVATETNSILIDLSPFHIYDKFPSTKELKIMFSYINMVSRLMQPTVIFVENVDKMFYRRVPKHEKIYSPTRLQKNFFKEIIKPLHKSTDKILVIGTATEPWLSRTLQLAKCFPSVILIPRSDYGSISYTLTRMLMKYHEVDREFDVHSVAQVLRGYDIISIKKAVENLLSAQRIAELYYKPLKPIEVVNAVFNIPDAVYTSEEEAEVFKQWYLKYTPWGKKLQNYKEMLDTQLSNKVKNDQRDKQNKRKKS